MRCPSRMNNWLKHLFNLDAAEKQNFTRFALPYSGINIALSFRQLTDSNLIPNTKNFLKECLLYAGEKPKTIDKRLEKEWQSLLNQFNKLIPVYPEWEIKIARLLIQAAHPIVTHLILLEQIEVFVSFGFEIGDVMDIQTWKTSGKNSGMQSTGGLANAIYVSCGGNPFVNDKKYATYTTDGFASMARMLIIAGQEMGHFADIIRNSHGQPVSRHSADLSGTKAKEPTRIGRLNDLKNNERTQQKLINIGLKPLAHFDRYHHHLCKYNVKNRLRLFSINAIRLMFKGIFLTGALVHGYSFVFKFRKEKYLGMQLVTCYEDMQFNLAPKADVYSRDDKDAEEAIACIEALARVPQQRNKWGDSATRVYMKNLYKIYYENVIPACIQSYNERSSRPYSDKRRYRSKPLWLKIKHLFKKPKKPPITPLLME